MDAALKKTVLRLFTYGLYAVTAKAGDELSAMTVNWITQVSFEPPMLALAVEHDSHSRAVLDKSGAFAVNIYESGQRDFAGRMGMTYAKHPEKLEDLAWTPGPTTGSPVMEKALAWVECRIQNQVPAGDHILYIAEVVDVGQNREGTPLTLKEAGFKYAG